MWALDVQDDPAVGTVQDDEMQRDSAAAIVEGDGDIGLVELPAQDRYREGAKLPGRALDQEIVGLILHGNPCRLQTWIEELACGGGIARQPVRELGRPVAVIGVDVPHQQFRRTETRLGGATTRELADAIVTEWDSQKEFIDPLTMPLTRFANSVVDAVVDRVEAVADDIAKYLGSDLLFYRAGHPEALVEREAALWDPVVFWAADALGAHFILAEGIVHVRQPESAIAAARAALPPDPLSIAALHAVTAFTGSALLAFALLGGVLDSDQVWAAAHVDEDWNIEKWGVDEEVAARRAARLVDFRAAGRILKSLNPAAG